MKKILSILMILVLVGGVVFAQVEPVFKGDATLSWGIDFGSGTDKDGSAKISHGFLNEASASVEMTFAKDATKSMGEGDVYAFIDLSKVNLGLSADMKEAKATGKVGEISAKIVFYGAYITLYKAPDMATNYATRVVNDDNYKPFKNDIEGFGTKIGYANKGMMDLDVGVKFVSNGSWKDRDAAAVPAHFVKTVEGKWNNDEGRYEYTLPDTDHEFKEFNTNSAHGLTQDTNNKKLFYHDTIKRVDLWTKAVDADKGNNGKYAFGIDFHMVPVEKYLTIDANFNMTFDTKKFYKKAKADWSDANVLNVGAKLTSSPLEGLNFVLGFDGGYAYTYTKNSEKSGVFAWALGFGADYKIEKVGKFDVGVYVASKATPYGQDSVVDAEANTKDGTDMAMTFGYSGLPVVEGLDIHARVNVFRLLSKRSAASKDKGRKVPIGLNVGAAYTAKISDSMSIKPYADVWGETNIISYADGTYPAGTPAANKQAYFGLAYKVGLAFMPMEHLTIDANWMHGKLGTKDNLGTGQKVTPCQHNAHNGQFTLSAKIAF